jgi:hypothetical protein
MANTVEIILSVLILGGAIFLARYFHTWKIKQAYFGIVDDLKRQGALSPETAVGLPYATRQLIKFGLRDHRPVALRGLIAENIVGRTEDGRYYILDKKA